MTDLFDFKPKATQFAVMGNPVKHSKSPQIHAMFAAECDIDMHYDRIQVDIGGFDQAVSHFAAHGGAGLNITVPFKVEAWQLSQRAGNRCSERANNARAVNTLVFEANNSVFGDNTDGVGLVTDLEHNIGVSLKGGRVLMVGAGGAVRGVMGPILQCEPEKITIANRTHSKAQELAQQFGSRVDAIALEKSGQCSYDVVINGTAASLQRRLPGLDKGCIDSDTVVYDMMYSQQPTVFMKWALEQGASSAHDGLGMLVEQAAESFAIWHGIRPQTLAVIQALRKI